jgi:hypothetical protein
VQQSQTVGNKKITRGLSYLFVLFFCLSSINFFQPAAVKLAYLYYIYYAALAVAIFLIVIQFHSSSTNKFALPVLIMTLAIIISAFMATHFWDQNLLDSFKAIAPYLFYIFFFLLISLKIKIAEIEEIFVVMSILYMFVFAISFIYYPSQIFGQVQSYGTERGFQRITVFGVGYLFLFSFYILGKYLKSRKWIHLGLFLVSIGFIFLLLTRTLIVASALFFSLYLLRKTSSTKKIFLIILICGFAVIVTQLSFVKILVGTTQEQIQNIHEDIRVQSADFYLNHFSRNIATQIFGNGQPYYGNSYAAFMTMLETEMQLFQGDIGYIGLYSRFGILAILAFILLFTRTLKIKINEDYAYCKYFLYFIFFISLIIDSPFNISYIPSIIIALYILTADSQSLQVDK